jgi:phage terminase large subunit
MERPELIPQKPIRDLFFRQGPDGEAVYIPSRYKVAEGGRGSGKSWSFARVIIAFAAVRKLRVLCGREYQNSIAESVHKLLSSQISLLGLDGHYSVFDKIITSSAGSEIIFEGLHNNVTKIKSMEGIDIVWLEEADKISKNSWEVLIPTIRANGSEIWVTYNPNSDDDPTHKMFQSNVDGDARVCVCNWQDNPYFPDVLRKEKDALYRVDPDLAEHVYGGKTRTSSDAQVLKSKWVVDDFEVLPTWDGPYIGVDWGFANDPTTMIKCWVSDNVLYVSNEVYGVGVDIDRLPLFFNGIEGARTHTSRADNARPETISYMRSHGYPMMQACQKWPGSVEDGVMYLRSFENIVIHPRCVETAKEAKAWSYKIDRLTKDVLPVLADAYNHCWDAIRYALGPMIKSRSGMLDYVANEVDTQKQKNGQGLMDLAKEQVTAAQ